MHICNKFVYLVICVVGKVVQLAHSAVCLVSIDRLAMVGVSLDMSLRL
jgi:hypothetical protein